MAARPLSYRFSAANLLLADRKPPRYLRAFVNTAPCARCSCSRTTRSAAEAAVAGRLAGCGGAGAGFRAACGVPAPPAAHLDPGEPSQRAEGAGSTATQLRPIRTHRELGLSKRYARCCCYPRKSLLLQCEWYISI